MAGKITRDETEPERQETINKHPALQNKRIEGNHIRSALQNKRPGADILMTFLRWRKVRGDHKPVHMEDGATSCLDVTDDHGCW